jgi:tRNA(adenine34) deaminase
VRSRTGKGLPSTLMLSLPVTLRAGDAITAPLTLTRPAAIQSSASRREHSPARAGNRTLRDKDPTAHAEILAIRQAAAAIGTERLVDCDLHVTLEPCTMCAAAISFARLRRLYYGAADPKGGGVDHGVRFFSSPTCHHRPEVYGGIGEGEATALLKDFFRDLR